MAQSTLDTRMTGERQEINTYTAGWLHDLESPWLPTALTECGTSAPEVQATITADNPTETTSSLIKFSVSLHTASMNLY